MRWSCGLLCGLLCLGASVGPLSAQEALPRAEQYTLRLEYLWWSPQLDGQLQKGFSNTPGTLLDARDDLGIERHHAPSQLQGALRLGGRWKVHGSWFRLDYHGDRRASRAFSYGTTNVAAQQQVVTSLKGNAVGVLLEWEPVQASHGFLAAVAGVHYFDVAATLVAVADPRNVSRVADRERLPAPAVGLVARVYPLERLSLEGRVSGFPAGGRGHLLDVQLAGRFHVLRRVAGTLGWRKLSLEGRDGRDFLKVDLKRWTLGIEISL